MNARPNLHTGSLIVIALSFFVGVAAYSSIPGNWVDQTRWARAQIAFSLPATTLVIYLIFRSLWRHDRIRTGNGAFEATYNAIVFRAMVFVFAMNALLMLALTDVMDVFGSHTWGKRVVVVMLGLAIMAVGNLLPRTRPNIAFGVRTKRTLTDPRLWQRIHRTGGYLAVALGAIILVAGIVVTNNTAAGLVLLLAGVFATIGFISYHRYANA
jgi:uncharacterized membrane protein